MNSFSIWLEPLSHLTVKASCLLTAVLLAGVALQRLSAARRYPLWVAAVLAMAMMPLAMVFAPAWKVLPSLAKETPLNFPSDEPGAEALEAGALAQPISTAATARSAQPRGENPYG